MKKFTLAECLKEAREAAQMTRLEVQDVTGIKRGYLSRYENGKLDNPTIKTFRKLAECYGMTVSELLEGLF
jgi:transcriptional regulator with XRE-family HTH domain